MIPSIGNGEYRALWRYYGIEPVLPEFVAAPTPAPLTHLIRTEGPTEPVIGFVLATPKTLPRWRKEEEAVWERIVTALELRRDDVALIQVSPLVDAPLTWDHFRDCLPPSLHTLVFFGADGLPPTQATEGALPWRGDGHWVVTHELGKLVRDAGAKKEAWGALKDLTKRLK